MSSLFHVIDAEGAGRVTVRQLKLAVLGNAEVNALVASRPRFSVLFRASAFELLLGCLGEIGEPVWPHIVALRHSNTNRHSHRSPSGGHT